MDTLVNIARWVFQVHFDWSCVILGALLGAWLDRGFHYRRARHYDGWWFLNLRRSNSSGRTNQS